MDEICFLRERSLSRMMPRLRADGDGEMVVSRKEISEDLSFDRCCGVPMRRYSVLDGLTVRRFDVSQAWTELSVEERVSRFLAESEAEKEMYN